MNKELGVDQNSWAAMYESDASGTEKLVVLKNGTKYTYSGADENFVDANTAKFVPPKGVTRLNVTVIGGGGGGAAGESLTGESKMYFPDTLEKDHMFVPLDDGVYKIVAVGGGGGGGGSAATCGRGSHGYSGGAVIATANLKKDKVYKIIAGQGGERGKGKSVVNSILGSIVSWPVGIVTGIVTLGNYSVPQMMDLLTPNKPEDGGGHGMSSIVSGDDLVIEAAGGRGGLLNRVKWFSCKFKTKDNPIYKTGASGNAVISKQICNEEEDGYMCQAGYCANCQTLKDAVEGGVSYNWTFGNGGEGGSNGHGGNPGHSGFVQISEIPTYGGGGGQAGAVSFYSFDTPPISKNSTDTYIPVYIGKGGKGGTPNATVNEKKGKDGQFSRFGTRIIASGGFGGDIKKVKGEKINSTYKSKGENGGKTSIGAAVIKQAKLGADLKDVLLGGYQEHESKINGQGHAQNNTGIIINAVPGSGGGGGGSVSQPLTSSQAGKGGNGATGLVLVTW